MELFLDSAKKEEVSEASSLGFLYGLTTTPTFLHREGVTDVDAAILEFSRMVNILHIEALGNNSSDIVREAERLLDLGLDPGKVVFKIPVSMEGAKACKVLSDRGIKVNIHLVYTLQQAYLAFCAGADYVCILAGRMQDQGQDALALFEQCVTAVGRFGYKTKIMFSSVRNLEHVRNAINLGAHACTMPWSVLKLLPQNSFTDIGVKQFVQHTEMLKVKASDLMITDDVFLDYNSSILDGLMLMTSSKLGAVIVHDDRGKIYRIFTDGDLRRMLKSDGTGLLHKKFSELAANDPVSVQINANLEEIVKTIKTREVDNLVVVENGMPKGIIDIQDLLKWI
jgi:transaldolase